MEKRYQVFVSSTYDDLRVERQEVMQALLELDCLPAGMELFPAADEDQWTLIKRIIEQSDYYIVIVGGRYGSKGPSGVSYTEMEFTYAREVGKPECAGINGHVVGDERALQERRTANPSWPRVLRAAWRGDVGSVDRGASGPGY